MHPDSVERLREQLKSHALDDVMQDVEGVQNPADAQNPDGQQAPPAVGQNGAPVVPPAGPPGPAMPMAAGLTPELAAVISAAVAAALNQTQIAARPPPPEFKEGADPEQFIKLFRVYVEAHRGTDPYVALCTSLQNHSEGLQWVLEYTGDKTLEAVSAAFTERFAQKGKRTDRTDRTDNDGFQPASKRQRASASAAAARQPGQNPARQQGESSQPRQNPPPRNQNRRAGPPDPLGLTRIEVGGRRLSHLEWRQIKEKGLCAKCMQPGHIMKNCPGAAVAE